MLSPSMQSEAITFRRPVTSTRCDPSTDVVHQWKSDTLGAVADSVVTRLRGELERRSLSGGEPIRQRHVPMPQELETLEIRTSTTDEADDAVSTHSGSGSSSSGSSLSEDEVRDVVRQVMLLVKRQQQRDGSTGSARSATLATVSSRECSASLGATQTSGAALAMTATMGTSTADSETTRTRPQLLQQYRGQSKDYRSVPVIAGHKRLASAGGTPPGAVGPIRFSNEATEQATPLHSADMDPLAINANVMDVRRYLFSQPLQVQRIRSGSNCRSPSQQAAGNHNGGSSGALHATSQPGPAPPHDAHVDIHSAANVSADDVHLSIEERRQKRITLQRQEALREETFIPATCNPPDVTPRNVAEVPVRSKGRWEDRLYTEYLSRKKRKELEFEAIRIARETQKEMKEILNECTFMPEVHKIHEQHPTSRSSRPTSRRGSNPASQPSSRTASVTQRNGAIVAAAAAERLFAAKTQQQLVSDGARKALEAQRLRTASRSRSPVARPTDVQLRLFHEHEQRQKHHEQLIKDYREREKRNRFTFSIKGQQYATTPLPEHVDPGAFQRLYEDQIRHDAAIEQLQQAAAGRRPTPRPQITSFAKRRVHSSQPVYERLSAPIKPSQQSQSHIPQGLRTTSPSTVSPSQPQVNSRPQHVSRGSPQPVAATALLPAGRTEMILQWMSHRTPNHNSLSRQSSGQEPVAAPPAAIPYTDLQSIGDGNSLQSVDTPAPAQQSTGIHQFSPVRVTEGDDDLSQLVVC